MLRLSLFCLALVALASPANATFVFDDFSSAGSAPSSNQIVNPNGVGRSLLTSGGATSFSIAGGVGTWSNVFGNNQVNLSYTFTDRDLYSIDRILKLTVGAGTTGSYRVRFRLIDLANPTVTYNTQVTGVVAGQNVFADVHSFVANGAAGSSMNSLQVFINREGGNGGGIGAGTAGTLFLTGGISAVPEPATFALLGSLVAPAVWFGRKKRKKLVEAA